MKANKLLRNVAALCIIFTLITVLSTALVKARYVKKSQVLTSTFGSNGAAAAVMDDDASDYSEEETYYPVYVRAAIVITWKDDSGNVYYKAPKYNDDYTLEIDLNEWEQIGEYYYSKPVESAEDIEALIDSFVQTEGADIPVGYHLDAEMIAQTIQVVGYTDEEKQEVYIDAWSDSIYSATTVGDGTMTSDNGEQDKEALYPLTIQESGGDDNESFLYTVKDNEGKVDLTISVKGGRSATILVPAGEYTVNEFSDWSWNYTSDGAAGDAEGNWTIDGVTAVTSFGESTDGEPRTVTYSHERNT